MGRCQGYEMYKESEVEWIGDIPESWKISKARFVSEIFIPQRNKPDLNLDEGLPWLTMDDMLTDRVSETSYKVTKEASIQSGSKSLKKGSVIASCVGNFSVCTINDVDLIINQQLQAFIPNKDIIPEYLREIVRVSGDYFQMIATSATVVYVNKSGFANMPVPLPPLDEQESIAYFLDRKTTQIDALIAKKAALIEKLDEKRTALISHAVTKGLDSSVPMKDSGVEWLGDIPEHWKRGVKLIQLAQEKQHSFVNGPFGSDLLTAELQDDGIPVIYSGDIKTNKFSRKSSKYVTEEKAIQLNFCRVDSGDLLLAKVGDPPGDAAIYPDSEESGIVTQDVVRIKVDRKKATPEYLALLMNSQTGKFIIKCISVEATRSRFSLGDFKGIRLFIPPLNEQVEISRYGEKILIEIGGQQTKIKEAIELLKEYRTALITNAVTGKIDVRQVARV
jgi:type I restriction enzyme, S subunit